MASGISLIVMLVTDGGPAADRIEYLLRESRYFTLRSSHADASRTMWEYPWDIVFLESPRDVELVRRINANEVFAERYVLASCDSSELRIQLLDAGCDEALPTGAPDDEILARLRSGDRVSSLKRTLVLARKRLELLTITDGLTGLYTHRHFHDQLASLFEIARKNRTPLGVVMFDVDHFKRINDALGHAIGDRLLLEISNILVTETRAQDIAARYGGEEFALIVPEATVEECRRAATRVRTQVAAQSSATGTPVTISAGVSSFPEIACASASDLLLSADTALYLAKRRGRNRVSIPSRPQGLRSPAAGDRAEIR